MEWRSATVSLSSLPLFVASCPVTSVRNLAYITLAGGGLLVADLTTTPMQIVGEYGQAVVYGAGCGGAQNNNQLFLNAGVSASSAGATQSMFAVFAFNDDKFPDGTAVKDGKLKFSQNSPMPIRVFQDKGNTKTNGNVEGTDVDNLTGQLPGISTRRDSHGTASLLCGDYVYFVDRIVNSMEVFDVKTYERTTFDLTSRTGQGGRTEAAGACFAASVLDDPQLPLNDPAPDLMDITPDGKYLMVAFRGPAPVSVPHSAQGSCPGVGIVQVDGSNTGRLVGVLRGKQISFVLWSLTLRSQRKIFSHLTGVVLLACIRLGLYSIVVVSFCSNQYH
jgi:hypothetical protein